MCIMPNTTLAFPFKNILGQQIRICKHEPRKKALLSNLQNSKEGSTLSTAGNSVKNGFFCRCISLLLLSFCFCRLFCSFLHSCLLFLLWMYPECKQDNYSISLIESWGSNHQKVWSSCLRSNLNKLSKNLLKLWYWLWLQTNFATLVRKGLHCIKP